MIENRNNKKRLFIGIPISDEIRAELTEFNMNQLYNPKIRYTAIENLHVTALFLGDTEIGKITPLKSKINEYLKGVSPFNLTFESFAIMPGKKPYMIWVKYAVNLEFSELSNSLSKLLQSNSITKPIPHITLARFKSDTDYSLIRLNHKIKTEKLRVNKLHLYESILHQSSPEYKILDTYLL